jgi:hypothetical protein
MIVKVNGEWQLVCEYFLMCDNPTLMVVDHPILDKVPCCTRCADKMDIPASKRHEVEITK